MWSIWRRIGEDRDSTIKIRRSSEVGQGRQVANSVLPFFSLAQLPNQNQTLNNVTQWPKLRGEQNARTVCFPSVFGECSRHSAKIVGHENTSLRSSYAEYGDIVDRIKRIKSEIHCGDTPDNAMNNCPIQIVVRLEPDFHEASGCSAANLFQPFNKAGRKRVCRFPELLPLLALRTQIFLNSVRMR